MIGSVTETVSVLEKTSPDLVGTGFFIPLAFF